MAFKEYLRNPQPRLDALADHAEAQRTAHEESAWEEYARKEAEFIARTDALCEDAPPSTCDCNVCPCKDLCNWHPEEV